MKLFAAMSSVLMSASLLFGATIAQADQLESVQQKGVLKVAVPQDFPPFGSVGTDLKPHGYDIDMAAYLAQKLDVKLELVPVTSANRIPYLQTMRYIIAPQAARLAIAPTVGFSVQIVKGTALASIIGFVELTKAGTMLNNATFQPFKVFALVALLYFAICFPLSALARYLETRNHVTR